MEEPVNLVSVYMMDEMEAYGQLYAMLSKRPSVANISHKKMPSFAQHREYVKSRPYQVWYLLSDVPRNWVGHVYLTERKEIGVQILQAYQKKGYATSAVRQIMTHNTGPFYANINPRNRASIAFFRKLGFHIISSTYKLEGQEGAQL
jgi:RimJ/RimL family protein N-acetyltransferase